ncbi:hypothetical protein [Paenibacillus woosongensis]|uniref:Uncharacterized protein n=1 Tax=Paenibacillus woosongensis TaxID=307580 RepID=A0A7X2YY82_9BACL|nr:hypothetical protein [Paenibacillus woosongensis]MUG44136.1 hypothetical protein [Paenibacillus woosongensis]
MDRFHLWALIILIFFAILLAIGILIKNLSAGSGPLPPQSEPVKKSTKNENKNQKYPPWFHILFAILLLSFCLRELAGLGLLMVSGPKQVSGVVTEIEKSSGRGKSFLNKVHIGKITVHYILPNGIKKGEVYTIQYTPLTSRPIGVKRLGHSIIEEQ